VSGALLEATKMDLLKESDTFDSYIRFEARLRTHEDGEMCKYFIRDGKTIEAARKAKITRPLKPEIKYYFLRLSCIHGGRKFKTQGSGMRKSRYVDKEIIF
jgi:hypothetical protein